MGFETPALLITAGLVALPIVAHLLRRQDVPTLSLPTIALLAQAKADDKRRSQLVDRLLFLCRVLAIMAIVAAAAGPFRSRSVTSASGPEALAIVIDDSMSMTAESNGRPLLENALETARDTIRRMDAISELTIVMGGNTPRTIVAASREHQAALEQLATWPTASIRADAICEAAEVAAASLADSDRKAHRLVVISDFANDAAQCAWPQGPVVQLVPTRTDTWRNVAVERIDLEPEKPNSASLIGRLELVGQPLATTGSVEIFQRGTRIAQAPIEWNDGGGEATIRFERPFDANPAAQVHLEVTDSLQADNKRGVLLRSSAAVHVLLMQAERNVWGRRRYVDNALAAASTSEVPFLVRRVSVPDLRRNALDWADVVIMSDIPLGDADLVDAVRGFVRQGGGLLVAPGNAVQPRRYAAMFGDLMPARFTARQAQNKRRVASSIFDGLGSVRVSARMPLEAMADPTETLVSFDDGSPALLTARRGTGQVAMMAISLDDAWSDLPYQPAFVPFIARIVARLAGSPKRSLAPFESIELPGSQAGRPTQVVAPSGRLETLEQGARTTYRGTDEIGAYRVMVDGADAPRFAFAVEPPSEESRPRFEPLPSLDAVDDTGASTAAIQNVERSSLTPWLLVLLALVLVAEGWLRHTPRPRLR